MIGIRECQYVLFLCDSACVPVFLFYFIFFMVIDLKLVSAPLCVGPPRFLVSMFQLMVITVIDR